MSVTLVSVKETDKDTPKMTEESNRTQKFPTDPPPDYDSVKPVTPSEIDTKKQNGAASNSAETAVKVKNGKDDDKDNEKKEEEKPMVGFRQIFRYADCLDITCMITGTIAAAAHGVGMPLMIVVFGNMIDAFVGNARDQNTLNALITNLTDSGALAANNLTADMVRNDPNLLRPIIGDKPFDDAAAKMTGDILEQMTTFAIYYIIIGCAILVAAYLQVSMWMMSSERQTQRIRVKFFRSILRQEIGWFDTHEVGELNTRLSDDINKVHDGIGDKLGAFVQWFCGFITGFTIGFVYGWKLTLVILAISPLLVVGATIMSKLAADFTSKELKAYARAGSVAEEVLGSIRTVMAFGGEQKESVRYSRNLTDARDTGIKKGLTTGLGMGFTWFVVFAAYALGFWYGSKLTLDEPDNYTAGTILVVFFAVLIGAFSLGHAFPNLEALATGRGAAHGIFEIIDSESEIDSASQEGMKPANIIGNVEFSDVVFHYPSRPDVPILKGLNLKVNIGETVALVGPSGCGKSTTVSLLQRFYDTIQGTVKIDGNNVRDLNVGWLREHIGVVSQEPILFGTTIIENIRYGRDGVTDEQIQAAAIEANAHDFIMKLPQKYETMVGERGAQLSGGQKQRVAIARALVRDPKILLLDEATSALDTESEAIVQAALDKVKVGRTTIVIAHRLSTVRNANSITSFEDGRIVEQGSHEELMEKQGIYYNLITLQQSLKDEDEGMQDFMKKTNPSLQRVTSAKLERGISTKSMGEKKEEEEEEKVPDAPMTRILRLNAPEWPYITIGCVASLINGGVQPSFAVIFAEILGVFQSLDLEEQRRKTAMYSALFLALGVVAGLAMFLQSYLFAKSGENLTMRLRQMAFKAILRQEIGWYDDHNNNTGALCTRLATDASQVQGATGVRIGMMIQNISSMGTAIIIAFVFGWQLTLVILGCVPLIAIAGAIQMRVLTGHANRDNEALEGAGKIAIETVENMRTVASLHKEKHFGDKYEEKLIITYKEALKKAHVYGITFGFSQAIIYWVYAAAFSYGAYLVKVGAMDYVSVFRVFGAIVFGAMALGQASSFAPDYGKAKTAANRMMVLFDRKPEIDTDDPSGDKLTDFSGSIEFKDVEFNYPTRPNIPVLRGLDVSVQSGQTLALCGSSGCGKSTTVQLIERFYDPKAGSVTADGSELSSLNISWLRSQIGIVSQEPILFDCTIAENIAYGDNQREVSMQEIIEAARSANIHNFIQSLPQGYDTNVGQKGTQLSGGQKQRVAIARALLRNPKVLLLDEATSALDTESQKTVQEALDKAQEGRTSIVIAHRLTTIQNADIICVIHNGKVVEQGKHNDLLALQGFYFKLNKAQIDQV
ncbi:unnamed protein product [Owenia fusiformis]|uniref:Uncharacterized protein n=1 Tax=Owenia fusiformis TaxID=6347 RepID=A0A8S4PZR3_OWEFU|nr:unnamed protein product [Owenia fusiformis]